MARPFIARRKISAQYEPIMPSSRNTRYQGSRKSVPGAMRAGGGAQGFQPGGLLRQGSRTQGTRVAFEGVQQHTRLRVSTVLQQWLQIGNH